MQGHEIHFAEEAFWKVITWRTKIQGQY